MNTTSISIADITVLSDRRPVAAAAVADLVRSINAIGLQTPITVRRDRDDVVLVAGRHRLEAVRSLGWLEVPVRWIEADAIDARLWEISENLHRAELTALERAEHVAEWIKLTEAKNKSASCADIPRGRGQPQGGLNAASRELGIDRTEAQRSVKIAGIAPEAKAAAVEAGLGDNQSALCNISAKPKAEQKAEVDRVKAKKSEPRKSRSTNPKPEAEPTVDDRKPISPALLLSDPLIEYVKRYVGAAAERGLLTADLVREIVPAAVLAEAAGLAPLVSEVVGHATVPLPEPIVTEALDTGTVETDQGEPMVDADEADAQEQNPSIAPIVLTETALDAEPPHSTIAEAPTPDSADQADVSPPPQSDITEARTPDTTSLVARIEAFGGQRRLAEVIGTSQSSISRVLGGKKVRDAGLLGRIEAAINAQNARGVHS